jgi:hypothetical protein
MVLKVMIGSLTASVIVLAGCNSEVGTALSSDNKAISDSIAKLEEKGPGLGGKGKGFTPKSIKGKVFNKPADENK